ncbi:MAG: hypothetical protein ABIA63_12150, partial [bacterium]
MYKKSCAFLSVITFYILILVISGFSQNKEKILHFTKDIDPDVIWLQGSGMSPTTATVTLSATTTGEADTMVTGKPVDVTYFINHPGEVAGKAWPWDTILDANGDTVFDTIHAYGMVPAFDTLAEIVGRNTYYALNIC